MSSSVTSRIRRRWIAVFIAWAGFVVVVVSVIVQFQANKHSDVEEQISRKDTIVAESNIGPAEGQGVIPRQQSISSGDDPLTEGWESEAFDRKSKKQLVKVARLLTADGEINDQDVQHLITNKFSCDVLRPSDVVEAYRDAQMVVLRLPEVPSTSGSDSDRAQGASGLSGALNALRIPVSDAGRRRAALKTVHVDIRGPSVNSVVRVESCGFSDISVVQQTALWTCHWNWPSVDDLPRLQSIKLEDFEEVALQSKAGAMLNDETHQLLGKGDAYQQQLRLGSS